jgi:1-acyl-sn-glycerol-3-phosphate acyltransferase
MVARKNWFVNATRITSQILLLPLFRLETKGRENLPQKSAFILLPKHQRWVDIPLLGIATLRSLYYVAKYDLFKNPLSNWFIRSLGGIPLNRKRPLKSRQTLKTVIECLKKGEGVVIFPEGTYYRNTIGSAHSGMVRFVLSRFPIPCIPVGIRYSEKGIRTVVRINFGRAMHADPFAPVSSFVDNIMKEIAGLSGLP